MISSVRTSALLGGLLAAGAIAGPVAVRNPDIGSLSTLQERIPIIPLGDFDLTTSHEDDVLFNIGFGTTSGRVGDAFHLEVECVDCRTWGSAVISTAGVNKNDDIIGDIISFFEHPVDTIIEAFDLDVKIDFENVGGHFDFNLFASDTVSYSFPIFQTETPVGCAVSEEVSVGLVLAIDLVFSLTAAIDLDAGFEFSFPEGAYITVDPLSGHIVDHGFTGGEVNHLPVTVTSGSATFKAALRVRIQAGTTVELFGTGFDFELGVYADLIEYVATIGASDTCELYITESVDVNIGAYAHAVVEIDYHTFGASPAVVTTLLDYPLPSLCLTRPVDTGIPALPTASLSLVTSGDAMISTPVAISTQSAASSSSSPVIPSSTSSTPGGIFQQTTSSAPTSTKDIYASPSGYANSTITSPPTLTTSTIISTDYITVTSCSSTILHCPASLASEIVITSTTILYTTVCPVGEVQPTTLPATFTPTISLSTVKGFVSSKSTIIVSPIPLTPCATPITETIYTPTFVNPTYHLPTATVFAVPYPNWNITSTPIPTLVGGPSTVIVAPAYSPTSSPSGVISSPSNSTVVGSISPPKPTSSTLFTSAASRMEDNTLFSFVLLFGAGVLAII